MRFLKNFFFFFFFFFPERTGSRYSKACLQNISRKHSKIWLLGANIKSRLTPKADHVLKT